MDDFEEDDPVELPFDSLQKQMYFIQLALESSKPAKAMAESFAKYSRAADSIGLQMSALEGIFPKLPPFPSVPASAVALLGVPSIAPGREAALQRKWRREYDAKRAHTKQADVSPAVLVQSTPPTKTVESSDTKSRSVDRAELILARSALLQAYKDATGHPNKVIYEVATAAGKHSCYKQKFYEWLRGELPATSATAVSLEQFLRTRPEFDRYAKRRRRKTK